MADGQHGGYRRPENPAPVSGPGSLSRRTDGGATQAPQVAAGGEYGSRQDQMSVQQGAPLQGGGGSTPVAAAPAPAGPPLPAFDAPTEHPNEDVRTGMGMYKSLGPSEMDETVRARLTAALPTLVWLASQPKASEQTRQFVRQLRSDL